MPNKYEFIPGRRIDKTQLKNAISLMKPGTRWPWTILTDGRIKNSPFLCIIFSIPDFNDMLNEYEKLQEKNKRLEKRLDQLTNKIDYLEEDMDDIPF